MATIATQSRDLVVTLIGEAPNWPAEAVVNKRDVHEGNTASVHLGDLQSKRETMPVSIMNRAQQLIVVHAIQDADDPAEDTLHDLGLELEAAVEQALDQKRFPTGADIALEEQSIELTNEDDHSGILTQTYLLTYTQTLS